MKYIVLPVYDSENPRAVMDYAVIELRSYEPPIYWGPFFSEASAHEHARAGQHRVPFEVDR